MKKIFFLIFILNSTVFAVETKFDMQSFVDRYCIKCHDEAIQKGDRRFDDLRPTLTDVDVAERWQEVLDVLNLGEMPPKKKKQPSKGELLEAVDWLSGELAKAEKKFNSHASTVTMRKMTQYEYDNTVHSIFGFESQRFTPSKNLPKDEIVHGFKNIGDAQITSPIYMNSALKAANEIVGYALSKGGEKPAVKTVNMPPKSFRTKNGRTGIRMEEGRNCVSLYNRSPKLAKAMSNKLKNGVSADGYYELELDLEGYGRKHRYPGYVYAPMRVQDKFLLHIAAEVYEDSNEGNTQDAGETLKLLEVGDERKKYKVKVWLNRGESPSLLYWNGPRMNSNFGSMRYLKKYYPERVNQRFKDQIT